MKKENDVNGFSKLSFVAVAMLLIWGGCVGSNWDDANKLRTRLGDPAIRTKLVQWVDEQFSASTPETLPLTLGGQAKPGRFVYNGDFDWSILQMNPRTNGEIRIVVSEAGDRVDGVYFGNSRYGAMVVVHGGMKLVEPYYRQIDSRVYILYSEGWR